MLHRGSRVDGADYFDEFGEADANAGILGGAALKGYEGVKEGLAQDGLQLRMACRFCGKDHLVTLEWKELFIAGSNGPGLAPVFPQGWAYSQNNADMYVSMCCSKCGRDNAMCPHFTPDECRRHVNSAANRGMISPQSIVQWKGELENFRHG